MSQFRLVYRKVTRMAGFYHFLNFWNGYILITVHVVFVGRLVCSVNGLYMELRSGTFSIAVRSTCTIFAGRGFVRDVFERLCERVEEKTTRSLFCNLVRRR